MVAARAVRNAVSSSAAMNAYGMPAAVSNVREPLGVVDWEEVIEGSIEGAIDGALEVDDA